MMAEWHFLRPWAWWLWIFPVLYGGVFWWQRRYNGAESCLPRELRAYLWKSGRGWKEYTLRFLPLIGYCAGVMALAGPVCERWEMEASSPQRSLSVVLNLSEEVEPFQLGGMKLAVYQLLDSLKEERVSLVVQGGSTHVLIPFTGDYRLIRSYLEWVSPEIMPVQGCRLRTMPGKVLSDEAEDFHSVLYLTPTLGRERWEEWKALNWKTDFCRVLVTQVGGAVRAPEVIESGLAGEGIARFLREWREDVYQQSEWRQRKDSFLWKDEGYKLAWVATFLLIPLFLRIRKGGRKVFGGICLVLGLSSCGYTHRKWSEAMTGYYLWTGDTLRAIDYSENALLRGQLWVKLGEMEKAGQEFLSDTTAHGLYNAGWVACHLGKYREGLRLFRAVECRQPDWLFVQENIHKLEVLLNGKISEETETNNWKGDSDADSYEKEEVERDGTETELWADQLVNEGHELLRVSRDRSPKRSEVLFRQIENNPKLFLRKRLEYEYAQEKDMDSND